MRIGYLLEFVDLAETLSFTATAKRRGVGESALSRHLAALEQEAGARLLDRTTRRVSLSDAGRELLPHARAIAEAWATWSRQAERRRAAASSPVIVGTNYFVADIIARFLAANPAVAVRQHSRGSDAQGLLVALVQAECDLIVLTDPPAVPPSIRTATLGADEFVAVLPDGHRLAGGADLDAADLRDEPFVGFPRGTEGDERLRAICRSAGFEPQVVLTAEVGSSLAQLVQQGLGVTVLHGVSLAKTHPAGVVRVPLRPRVRTEVVVCWDGARSLSPAAGSLLRFLQQEGRLPAS